MRILYYDDLGYTVAQEAETMYVGERNGVVRIAIILRGTDYKAIEQVVAEVKDIHTADWILASSVKCQGGEYIDFRHWDTRKFDN